MKNWKSLLCIFKKKFQIAFFFIEELATQSAFYRPKPAVSARYHTATPYSDALKAAAVLPGRTPSGYFTGLDSTLSLLRADFRRSFMTAPGIMPMFPGVGSYTADPHTYRGSTLPLVYRPKIITHDFQYYKS